MRYTYSEKVLASVSAKGLSFRQIAPCSHPALRIHGQSLRMRENNRGDGGAKSNGIEPVCHPSRDHIRR
jgi:hypothetical protein